MKLNLPFRITRSPHCPRHLELNVMERFGLWCHVLSGTTYCVVSTVLLVPLRRDAMSCPFKLHHGRYSQSAATVQHHNEASANSERLNYSKRFGNLATSTLTTVRMSE